MNDQRTEGIECPKLRAVEARPVTVDGRRAVCLFDPQDPVSNQLCVSPDDFFALQHFDGCHSLRDIQAEYMRRFGALVFTERLQELARQLDEKLLLDSPRYRDYLTQEMAAFARAEIRRAAHAGSAYPSDPGRLNTVLDPLLASDSTGRMNIPSGAILEGAVLPHIDLTRGAPIYGPTLAVLQNAILPTFSTAGSLLTFIILGTAHAGMSQRLALTKKAFETPLGRVETDADLVSALVERAGPELMADEYAHKREHSIEIQVLLLQHLFGAEGAFQILPVLCGSLEPAGGELESAEGMGQVEAFTAALADCRRASGTRSVVLASADLAHLGPQFGDQNPIRSSARAVCEQEDRALLDRMTRRDAAGFYQSVVRDGNRRRVCGLGPIYVLLKTIEPSSFHLVGYHQAVDEMGHCLVSFAGIIFWRDEP